jgi:hypothetical protein
VLLAPFRGRRKRLAATLGLLMDFPVWSALRARVPSNAHAVAIAVRALRAQ